MRPILRHAATVVVLSPVSLVLSHNLAFLTAYGSVSDAVLRATGHAEGWAFAVRMAITISVALGVAAGARLVALLRTARRVEAEQGLHPRTDWRALGRTVLVLWAWLAIATAVCFVVQENAERATIGQPLPGLAPLLTTRTAGPLLIIPVISLVVALVGGLFRWGITALRARIAAAKAPRARQRPAGTTRPAGSRPRRSGALSRNLGLRAPPTPRLA